MTRLLLSIAFGLIFQSAISVTTFGQIPSDTVFFDYDFTSNDQITAQFDSSGIFTNSFINRGPFVDGPLNGQVSFFGQLPPNLSVDTAGGFAMETAAAGNNYRLGNIFVGQPKLIVGDTVRLISELSFTKNLVGDVEVDSLFDNFFFGFRGGAGTNEFTPNEGVSQAFRYNAGADNSSDSDSNIQAFAHANRVSSAGASGDGNIAQAAATLLGIDIANGDFETDIFRIVTDAVVTASTPMVGTTFEITTSIENQAGMVLGITPATTTATDTGITLAQDRIQFAIRDGNSGASDPTNLKIHRLAAVFNPSEAIPEPGSISLLALASLGAIVRRRR